MEMRMVSPVHTFQSMMQLNKGQTAAKGIEISIPSDVEHYASVLPRLVKCHDCANIDSPEVWYIGHQSYATDAMSS